MRQCLVVVAVWIVASLLPVMVQEERLLTNANGNAIAATPSISPRPMLARNATIKIDKMVVPRATVGTEKARNLFFPNQKNSADGFVNFSGNEHQVNNFL